MCGGLVHIGNHLSCLHELGQLGDEGGGQLLDLVVTAFGGKFKAGLAKGNALPPVEVPQGGTADRGPPIHLYLHYPLLQAEVDPLLQAVI